MRVYTCMCICTDDRDLCKWLVPAGVMYRQKMYTLIHDVFVMYSHATVVRCHVSTVSLQDLKFSLTELCLVNRLDVVGAVYHLLPLDIIISCCPMSERAISFHLLFDGWRK